MEVQQARKLSGLVDLQDLKFDSTVVDETSSCVFTSLNLNMISEEIDHMDANGAVGNADVPMTQKPAEVKVKSPITRVSIPTEGYDFL